MALRESDVPDGQERWRVQWVAAPVEDRPCRLATESETLDDASVSSDLGLLEVVEQPTTLADQQQESTTTVMVVLVLLEVLGEVGDPLGEQRDLNLG